MTNKKSLMGLAALLIVVFHFWMPLTTGPIEINIYKCTYLGVDIFFLLSAYSLSHMRQSTYLSFIANRLGAVYLPFAILAVIAAIYKKWAIGRLALVLCGAEFFKRGGGAFLWFAPAIILVYLIAPIIIKLKKNLGWRLFVLCIVTWLALVCLLQFGLHYTTIFILLNRIPIFTIGLYLDEIRDWLWERKPLAWLLPGLVLGAVLMYRYCGNVRLSKPIADFYYLLLIPFTVSLVLLCEAVAGDKAPRKGLLAFIGGFTLELYGLQMIFGYDIETYFFKMIKDLGTPMILCKLAAFATTVVLLVIPAWIFSEGRKKMKKIWSLIISAIMIIGLVGCGAQTEQSGASTTETTTSTTIEATTEATTEATVETPTAGDSLGNKLAAAFREGIAAGTDLEALTEELANEADMNCMVVPVEEGFLNGMSGDITGFSKGYQFAPMISSIAFMGYVFESDDAEGLQSELLSKADPRWNICTEAEETVCVTSGNYVFFVMCPGE